MVHPSLSNTDFADLDVATHLHPFTNLERHRHVGPTIMVKGEGIHVIDITGRRYIEAMSGLWCASLGFSESRLAAVGAEALHRLPYYHSFYHKTHDTAVLLAERLLSMMPVPMSKVFFANSGSEANDTAIKLVWYCNNIAGRPQKKKIIARHRGYHGVTMASASLTGLPNAHREWDLPLGFVRHVTTPHFYRHGLPGESEADFATRLAEEIEELIRTEGPESVAAFIAEPVIGAGGVILPPETYFEKVQAVLQKYEVILIADEVICGFGRTGCMFGSETFGLKPDIITCAKALSAGYQPISAVIVSEAIFRLLVEGSRRIGTFGHGFTYSGHPVAAAVALEAMRIYERDCILDHVNAVAPRFQARLKRLGGRPFIGETRGIGLIGAVEFVADTKSRNSFDLKHLVGSSIARECEAEGLIVRPIYDSIAFSPPLIINTEEIDQLFDRFEHALDKCTPWLEQIAYSNSTNIV
jgi:4-aminobutyrate---pyruvate transaminase